MSLKQELQTWSDALVAFDRNDYERALDLFKSMEPGSKIYFNVGLIHATRGEHELAIEAFEKAIELDSYLAIAYFQAGVSRFLMKQYEEARRDFDDAWLYLRSNEVIDYEQIGLPFQLYSCEILFNRGLCLVYMGRVEEGLKDWSIAMKEKYTQEHDVIDEATLDRGQGYTVFSVSVGTVFRPSDSKLANLERRNFLGKTTVIAAANPYDLHLDFQKVPSADPLPVDDSRQLSKTRNVSALSRSQTVATRLASSVDGVARPLRRRPTLDERKLGQSQLKRSLTAPPSAATSATQVRPTRLAPGPASDVIPQEEQNASGSSSRSISVAEKRNRRHGLTIQLPSTLASYALSNVTTRSPYLEVPHRRTASVPSPSSTSPRPRTPHRRSASLPSPNFLTPQPVFISHDQHHQPINHLQRRPPLLTTIQAPPLPPPPRPANTASTRQDSSSTTSSTTSSVTNSAKHSNGSSSSKLCLSSLSGGNHSSGFSSSTSGSALLAYLQDVEKGLKARTEVVVAKDEEEKESLRIRLRYRGQVRAMMLSRDINVLALAARIRVKLNSSHDLALSYQDSDGCFVSIIDEEDWQSALDVARYLSLPHKLEIIVEELDS